MARPPMLRHARVAPDGSCTWNWTLPAGGTSEVAVAIQAAGRVESIQMAAGSVTAGAVGGWVAALIPPGPTHATATAQYDVSEEGAEHWAMVTQRPIQEARR